MVSGGSWGEEPEARTQSTDAATVGLEPNAAMMMRWCGPGLLVERWDEMFVNCGSTTNAFVVRHNYRALIIMLPSPSFYKS